MEDGGVAKSKISELEKFMPKIKEGYYANIEDPVFEAKDRQDTNLVKGILTSKKAYSEFLTNILIYITGVVKLDRMNQSDDAVNNKYETVVSCSDEAYGLLLLEDKSVLWREVLRRRRASSSGDGTLSMGVKKEITIGDTFGDKYTLYSNGGVLAPDEKKGWSVKGIERYNEYYAMIMTFRESEEGKAAMKRQRSCWTKSPLFPKKKRKVIELGNESNSVKPVKIKIRCMRQAWV